MSHHFSINESQSKHAVVSETSRRLSVSASNSRLSGFTGKRAIPVISRSYSERNENPDRITLDGRDLLVCPILEQEDGLRIVSFENNYIRCIERLSFQKLIFLDFYNNNLQSLSGLDAVPNLRVLLLGKNNIRSIHNLHYLPYLNVLDLHSNNINRIENLHQLKELQILNLEHNRIERVSKIAGLNELVELNLSHNHISHLSPLKSLIHLQRLFLSHNRIDSVSAIEEVCCVRSLIEFSLKWNPITRDLPLMKNLIQSLPNLNAFDLSKNGVLLPGTMADNGPDVQPNDRQLEKPSDSVESEPGSGSRPEGSVFGSYLDSKPVPWYDVSVLQSARMNGRRSVTLQRIQQWWERIQNQLDCLDSRDVPSYYKFEDNKSKLIIYGFGFHALDLEQASSCQCVSFNYVPFNGIIPFFNRLVTWPHLKRLEFANNALCSFGQFDSLSVRCVAERVSFE